MIQANEVRLGNRLILSDGSNEFPITVEPHDFQQMLDGDRLYKPIPLTPEILEKCGLKRTGRYAIGVGGYNTYGIGRVELLQPKKGDPFTLGFYETEVKYLHQLQNLYFALTGQELTVNL